MNKSGRFIVIAAVVALLALIAASFAQAQDATATPDTSGAGGTTAESTASAGAGGMVTCDADLITELYVAQHFFGFDQVASQMTSSGATNPMVDLSTIDKGQFGSWFNAPMSGTGPWTSDQVNTVASMMAMDDATLQSTMMGQNTSGAAMTTLNPVSVAGENPSCTQLRTELTRFFQVLSFENATNGMSMSGANGSSTSGTGTGTTGSGTGAESTPAATATTSG